MPGPAFIEDGPGVVVVVDGQPQSYVDLTDPLDLAFEYVQHFALALDSLTTGPLAVTHVGGGGLTFPRWVNARRPGSTQVVLEPDAALTEKVRERLPLPRGHRIRVRAVDGRTGIRALADSSADVLVLDAFAEGTVPPSLVTVEWFGEVARVLRPAGLLLANLADEPGLRWARRVVASASASLPSLALLGTQEVLKGRRYGNVVLVATRGPLDVAALARACAPAYPPTGVRSGSRMGDGARPFTDADALPSPPPPEPGTWRRR